jgi:trans-2,3-dihydro-3-hydroxyanthranilate isomerase
MWHPYILADVFTGRLFGGNQLAVFPDASEIPLETMPQIARELNLSETVFVLPPSDPRHSCRLRIFTPAMELPFAGHPTVGTACVLAATGRAALTGNEAELVFEENVGPVTVRVRCSDQRYFAQFDVFKLPEEGPPAPPIEKLAAMLTLSEDDVLDGVRGPRALSCGVPFLFITLRDRAVLERVRLNASIWSELLSRHWAPHVYVIAHEPQIAGSLVRARMFAPAMGIIEDPATGAAAAALPGYLGAAGQRDGIVTIRIEQGLEMGRPSAIDVEAAFSSGVLQSVRVGGECVMVGKGKLDLGA